MKVKFDNLVMPPFQGKTVESAYAEKYYSCYATAVNTNPGNPIKRWSGWFNVPEKPVEEGDQKILIFSGLGISGGGYYPTPYGYLYGANWFYITPILQYGRIEVGAPHQWTGIIWDSGNVFMDATSAFNPYAASRRVLQLEPGDHVHFSVELFGNHAEYGYVYKSVMKKVDHSREAPEDVTDPSKICTWEHITGTCLLNEAIVMLEVHDIKDCAELPAQSTCTFNDLKITKLYGEACDNEMAGWYPAGSSLFPKCDLGMKVANNSFTDGKVKFLINHSKVREQNFSQLMV